MTAPRIRRRVAPPTLVAVAAAGAALDRWAAASGLADERRRELLLAYDELASNVANHARRATELVIEARLRRRRGAVLVVVDDGARFDPLARTAPRTDQPLAERPIGGLGIHLVRALAERVRYERRGRRNRLVVDFRR